MSTEQTEGEKGEEDGKCGGRVSAPLPGPPASVMVSEGRAAPSGVGRGSLGCDQASLEASPPAPINAAEGNRTGWRAGWGHAGPPGRGGGAGPRRAGRPLGTLMVVVLRSSYLHSHSRQ